MRFLNYKKNSYSVGIKNSKINKLVIPFLPFNLSQKLRNPVLPSWKKYSSLDPTDYNSSTF